MCPCVTCHRVSNNIFVELMSVQKYKFKHCLALSTLLIILRSYVGLGTELQYYCGTDQNAFLSFALSIEKFFNTFRAKFWYPICNTQNLWINKYAAFLCKRSKSLVIGCNVTRAACTCTIDLKRWTKRELCYLCAIKWTLFSVWGMEIPHDGQLYFITYSLSSDYTDYTWSQSIE